MSSRNRFKFGDSIIEDSSKGWGINRRSWPGGDAITSLAYGGSPQNAKFIGPDAKPWLKPTPFNMPIRDDTVIGAKMGSRRVGRF